MADITWRDAEAVYDEQYSSFHDMGSANIRGVTYDWWADSSCIWFYEPGNDGDTTVARFDVERSFVEQPNRRTAARSLPSDALPGGGA